jgi:hypothetical protein
MCTSLVAWLNMGQCKILFKTIETLKAELSEYNLYAVLNDFRNNTYMRSIFILYVGFYKNIIYYFPYK